MTFQRVSAVSGGVALGVALGVAVHALQGSRLSAAASYKAVPGWGQLAAPLKWGEVPNVAIDPKGTVFVFTRTEPPVVELDARRQGAQDVGTGNVRLAARHPLRSRRQPLGHRRARRQGQRPAGLQVERRRQQGADDARHERRLRRRPGRLQRRRATSPSLPTATSSSPTAT